ncbi:unnamed protein product [Diamesa hyperborea]
MGLLEEGVEPVYRASEWKPLTFSYVEYPIDDPFGKLMAILALAPLWVVSAFTAVILRNRDLHTIFFFIGTVLNEWMNMALKYAIKEPRPVVRDIYYVQYGMPSSHAQFMFFFTTYTILFCIKRLHQNSLVEKLIRVLVISTCIISTALICYGRIYLLYHTLSQVIVGALLGLAFGGFWFTLVHVFLTPLFPKIVAWRISELFLIRDTTLIPNILFFEYTATRQETRARNRKLSSMKSQ